MGKGQKKDGKWVEEGCELGRRRMGMGQKKDGNGTEEGWVRERRG
jgi:hypothetical protein